MNRRTFLGSVAMVALSAALGSFLPSGAFAQDAEVDTSRVTEMLLGDPDAPIEVIEYASFTCPHCAHFHETVFGQLRANYIDTGKIRFINREVYFDRYGLWAGMVARCGDNANRYFGIADLLFSRQREWLGDGEPVTVTNNLRRMGKTAGLTDEMLDSCLNDQAMAEALVAVFQENMERDNVEGTPTFFIDGEKYANMSYEEFAMVLDKKLGG
jgi:protein-disulfide isomerase